ncbi:MAG: ATP-binding protein [Pikeienuella sp.]
MKLRPPIRLVLALMILIAMGTPFVGLFFLRVIENQLIRKTEAELISQSAAIAAVYASEIRAAGISPRLFGPRADGPFDAAHPEAFIPLNAQLDLASDPVLPPRPDARAAGRKAPDAYLRVGEKLSTIIKDTRKRTLAGMLLLDSQGVVIGGSGPVGASLAHVPEVHNALKGHYSSALRTRLRHRPPPMVYTITKGASLRIFTAFPVIVHGRAAGVVYASRTPPHVMQMAYAERDKLAFAGIAMLGLVLVFAFVASRAITAPIRQLTERTRAIAAGDRDAMKSLNRHGTAEVAELSEIFLRTARQLHNRSDDLAAFAAHVSHELKSPLTAIQGAAELMRDADEDMSSAERAKFLGNIVSDTRRLDILVRRLLELARAEARGGDEGSTSLSDVEADLSGRAGLSIIVSDPKSVRLAISTEKLLIILHNLADNAALHGAKRLSVRVNAVNGRGRVDVSDDGEGVSDGNSNRIFDPFFTTRRDSGGTGMGLSIIRALLVARDGSIEVGPNAPGASFVIDLPIAR